MSGFSIGVISDTHGLLRPEALNALAGVNHIVHAGDVGDPAILDTLSHIAPLTAIRGNIDVSGPCAALPSTEAIELCGKLIYVLHSIADLDLDPSAAHIHLIISGHSHRASIEHKQEVLYLNPGSAGPRRFRLPVTLARIEIDHARLDGRIITLDPA